MSKVWIDDFSGTCHHKAEILPDGTIKEMAWSHPYATWAWYDTAVKTVFFGGMWQDVPDWKREEEPTEEELHEYAKKFSDPCRDYLKFFPEEE